MPSSGVGKKIQNRPAWNRIAGAHAPHPGSTASYRDPGTLAKAWPASVQLTRSRECRIGSPGVQLKLEAVSQKSSPTRTTSGSE